MKVSRQYSQTIPVSQKGNAQHVGVSTEVEFLKGDDGISPTIEVEKAEGGFNVTITDAEGVTTFFLPSGNAVTDEQVQDAVNAYLKENPVMVDVTDTVTEGDMRPVTSNAVCVEMGNINALLKTI